MGENLGSISTKNTPKRRQASTYRIITTGANLLLQWELYNDNYEAKDLSLRDIISHNDVSWLPAEHRNNFKERVEKAKIGNFELLFDRIELISVDFDWKDLKGVMGA